MGALKTKGSFTASNDAISDTDKYVSVILPAPSSENIVYEYLLKENPDYIAYSDVYTLSWNPIAESEFYYVEEYICDSSGNDCSTLTAAPEKWRVNRASSERVSLTSYMQRDAELDKHYAYRIRSCGGSGLGCGDWVNVPIVIKRQNLAVTGSLRAEASSDSSNSKRPLLVDAVVNEYQNTSGSYKIVWDEVNSDVAVRYKLQECEVSDVSLDICRNGSFSDTAGV